MEKLKSKLENIADELAAYSRNHQLSQRQLADLLGKEVGYINNVLQGKANLTLRTVVDFEERLGITLLEPPGSRWAIRSETHEENIAKTGHTDRSSFFRSICN